MASSSPIIRETFFEDRNADIFTFYTGKNAVLGLKYPDASISNKGYKYIRVGYIVFNSSDDTDEFCIDEKINIQLENITVEGYDNSKVANIHIFGMVRGTTVIENTFKCSVESAFENVLSPNVYLATQNKNIDGIQNTILSIWVETSNVDRVFLNSESSHAVNKLPLNVSVFDCKYLLYFIDNDSIVVNDDTTNLDSFIDAIKFCKGVDRFSDLIKRVIDLESKPSLDIRYADVEYDTGFEPIYTGSDASNYQVVPPMSINYGLHVPFMTCDVTNKYVKINSSGKYQLQLISGLFSNDIENSNTGLIEVSFYINTDKILKSVLEYDPKLKVNQLSTGVYVTDLEEGDILRVRFKFLGTKGSDIRNNGYTSLKVVKLI